MKIGTIILEHEPAAEEVLDVLKRIVRLQQFCTVADLYTLVKLPSNYVDNRYGWKDLSSANVVHDEGEGYSLNLPRPELLD